MSSNGSTKMTTKQKLGKIKKLFSKSRHRPAESFDLTFAPTELKTVKYTVKDKGEFTYIGSVINEETPHGTGSLHYPNGTVYEGDFENGKRCGFGKLKFTSTERQKSSWVALGEWTDGRPNKDSRWKLSVDKKWEYWGYVDIDGKSDMDALDISDFHMNKEGELYVKPNDSYFGSFSNNKKNGYGVQVFSNMNRYFGGWKDDVFQGHGVFMYSDGTIHEGKFEKGERKGKGTMHWPNGDSLYGKWSGSNVEKGRFTKGSCKNCMATALFQIKHESSSELKNQLEMGLTVKPSDLDSSKVVKPSFSLKWKQFRALNLSTKKAEQEFLFRLFMEQLKDVESFKKCVRILIDGSAQNSDNYYIRSAYEFFISSFQGNYHSAARRKGQARSLLLYYAIEDVQSFIAFLSEEIWGLFEDLFTAMIEHIHNSAKTKHRKTVLKKVTPIILDLTEQQVADLKSSCQTEFDKYFSDIIHTKLFDTLFSLYEKTYQEKDVLLNHKLETMEFVTPLNLGVPKDFLPSDPDEPPYSKSISILDDFGKTKTFNKKIEVLTTFRECILTEIRDNRMANRKKKREEKGTSSKEADEDDQYWNAGADDITPVQLYVFMKSAIRNHNAQFKYINDWKGEDIVFNPVSHVITFYEGFLNFVEDLDPSLRTPDDVFISNYTMTKQLENALEAEMRNSSALDSHTFTWLPSLLVYLSLEIGRRSGESISRITLPSEGQMKLAYSLSQNIESVQRVLNHAKIIGFTITVDNSPDGTSSVYADLQTVYPTVVYSEISVHMTKFIHFELDSYY